MNEYDYIIVGAGTAGCVLANRLSASGRYRVLLLEAGGSDWHPLLKIPIGYGRTFNDARFNWMYEAQPDPTLENRTQFLPRGKVLGGSSSINAMVYVRGQPGDFDDWAAAGNPGWAWQDVLPYFRKLEDHDFGASEFHGAGGPVHVSDVSAGVHPLCETFLATAEALGFPRTRDFNGAQTEGAGLWQINTKDGVRVSSSTAYLRPAAARACLEVKLRAQALRIQFAGPQASGIEYLQAGARLTARARREVIVSAGSLNSPQLLELSGIGDPAILQPLGLPVTARLPAVGNGLQDHLAVSYFYRSRVPTLNEQLAPRLGKLVAGVRYLLTRGGPLAMSVNQAGAFVRTRSELTRPNLHIYFNPASYNTTTLGSRRRLMNPDPFPGFLMSFNTCRPVSRGSVHVRSPDPLAAPAVTANALSAPEDIRDVYEGARLLRRLTATQPLASAMAEELQPGAAVQSEEALLEDFRRRAGTVFHASCTCAMGPDRERSVVNARLRVHGVGGLRVVDASVFPNVTSGNTNTPTYMVAEKAADLILEDARG